MAKKDKGYIPLWRDIKDHWLWQKDEPFDRRSAWIDLILSVNYEEKKIRINNKIITIRPGQIWTSYKKLAEKWGWSRARVYRYTELLKSDGMIYVDATPNGTLLTLVNYGDFALRRNTYDTTDDTTDNTTLNTTGDTTDDTQLNKGNKGNKDKEGKEKARTARGSSGGEHKWQTLD